MPAERRADRPSGNLARQQALTQRGRNGAWDDNAPPPTRQVRASAFLVDRDAPELGEASVERLVNEQPAPSQATRLGRASSTTGKHRATRRLERGFPYGDSGHLPVNERADSMSVNAIYTSPTRERGGEDVPLQRNIALRSASTPPRLRVGLVRRDSVIRVSYRPPSEIKCESVRK